MKKLILSLLICITLFVTINFVTYADDFKTETIQPDLTFNPFALKVSLRDTSEGLMAELLFKDYNQILSNYEYLLKEGIKDKTEINNWKEAYDLLLKDTVWKDSYNEALLVIKNQEEDLLKVHEKNNQLKVISIGLGIVSLTTFTVCLFAK